MKPFWIAQEREREKAKERERRLEGERENEKLREILEGEREKESNVTKTKFAQLEIICNFLTVSRLFFVNNKFHSSKKAF